VVFDKEIKLYICSALSPSILGAFALVAGS
jgi:hypothetical protein